MKAQVSEIHGRSGKILKVFYDGLCPLCSREIDHYRGYDNAYRIDFIDIANPNFKPESEGLSGKDIHKKFHVKTEEGKIISGVDAFIEIWKTLEIWVPMQKLSDNSWTRPFFEAGYFVFAKIRPLFRNNECTTDYCQTNNT